MAEHLTYRRAGFGLVRVPITRPRLARRLFLGIVKNMRAAGWTDCRIATVLHVKREKLPAPQTETSIWPADMQKMFQAAAE